MNKKFVCLECGCHNVEGDITALVKVIINSLGEVEIISLDWDTDEYLYCLDCGGNEIVEIGKKVRY